jgi:ATP-dependent Clp protease ATP-binding subunit ClpC
MELTPDAVAAASVDADEDDDAARLAPDPPAEPVRPPGVPAPASPGSSPRPPARAPGGDVASPQLAPDPSRAPRPRHRPAPPVNRRPPTPMLDSCGTDWVVAAARGELPPMVGRDHEMEQLIASLLRPAKPNVLLVGPPGVGKSALIEGLAARLALGTVPDPLLGRPLIALNMAELTRESRYYGMMEQRLGQLIAEARAVRAILFIDEGHAMVGAGGRDGTGDVASILKPILARGDLSVISATTEDEYRRFIVPNGALERRFNVVHVDEPDRATVRTMLAAHRDAIADRHGVAVSDDALDRLVTLTAIRDASRHEPDRSRDLLDQAVARAIAADEPAVSAADIEATSLAVSGAPDVTEGSLRDLEAALVRDGLMSPPDAAALADRLGIAFAGLSLRPARPRATVLVLRTPGSADGAAVAEAIARGVYDAAERVITINVGGIADASGLSGFLGTPQGYVGHGVTLPIHALAERPNAVLLLRGVDAAHESLRSLLARAIRDGHLVDAMARRIALSKAVVVLEARAPRAEGRRLGFGAGTGVADGSPATGPTDRLAGAALGEDLAAECDLVAVPPEAAVHARSWVAQLMDRLAETYRASGVELAWDVEVETALAAELGAAGPRDRERAVETRVGRAVRGCLAPGRRPIRARVRNAGDGLVAALES